MKIWKKILLGTLLVLILGGTGLGLWQRENITAAYKAVTREPEQIAQDLDQVRTDYQQVIKEQTKVEFKPPTLEQSEALLAGTAKAEDVKKELGLDQTLQKLEQSTPPAAQEQPPAQQSPTQQPGSTSSVPEAPDAETVAPQIPDPATKPETAPSVPPPVPEKKPPTAQELLDLCVAELTACRVDLMALLGDMKQEAVNQWNGLDPKERTRTKKKEIGLAGLQKCYTLETVVDDQVQSILDRYEVQLKAIGAELSPLDTLWEYYQAEKAAQKAYYLNKYLDYEVAT